MSCHVMNKMSNLKLSFWSGAAVSSSSSVVLTSSLPPWSGAALLILLLWSGASFQLLAFGRCCFSCSFLGGVEVSSSSWLVLTFPRHLGWCSFLLLHAAVFPSSFWVVLISSLLTTAQFSKQCYIDTLCT